MGDLLLKFCAQLFGEDAVVIRSLMKVRRAPEAPPCEDAWLWIDFPSTD